MITLKESYEWAIVPEDLPKENLVLITAKTPASMYHPTDPKYKIRKIPISELEAAGRSLAQRPVGDTHATSTINGAFVVDSQYNPLTQSVEALVYLPTDYINWIKSQEAIGKKVEWSVEYTFREAKFQDEGVVEFSGVVFNRVDILRNLAPNQMAGDRNTNTQLVDDYLRSNRGLMEATTLSYEGKYKEFFDSIKGNFDPVFVKSEILRLGIMAEMDAVNLYEQLSTLTDDPVIKEVLLSVAKEEKVHAGEFEAVLEKKDPEQSNQSHEGKEEVEKMTDEKTMKEAAELSKLTEDFNKISAELKEIKEKTIPSLETEKNALAEKVAKIPEIEKARDDATAIATRLQANIGNVDKEKAKAVREAEERGKQKVISAVREVLPENTMVGNGRALGPYRALADSINKKLCEVSEE